MKLLQSKKAQEGDSSLLVTSATHAARCNARLFKKQPAAHAPRLSGMSQPAAVHHLCSIRAAVAFLCIAGRSDVRQSSTLGPDAIIMRSVSRWRWLVAGLRVDMPTAAATASVPNRLKMRRLLKTISRPIIASLGRVQLMLMQVLWTRGSATAREITEDLTQLDDIARVATVIG